MSNVDVSTVLIGGIFHGKVRVLSDQVLRGGVLYIPHAPEGQEVSLRAGFNSDRYLAQKLNHNESGHVKVFVFEHMKQDQATLELLRTLLRLSVDHRIIANDGEYIQLIPDAESSVGFEQVRLGRLNR